MIEIRVPGKKTIRRKLQRQRKRVGGQKLVFPDEQLASIVGPEARSRKELARHIHVYAEERGLVDPERRVVRANPALVKIFWGRNEIRQSDLVRVATYHVLPGREVAMAGPLPGKRRVIVRPPRRPTQESDEKEKENSKEEASGVR